MFWTGSLLEIYDIDVGRIRCEGNIGFIYDSDWRLAQEPVKCGEIVSFGSIEVFIGFISS